jgi:hypothetical protein
MAAKLVNTFSALPGYALGHPAEVWDWTDSSLEDSAFIAWVQANGGGTGYTIDRSGSPTQLKWTDYYAGAQSVAMPAGSVWGAQATTIGTNGYAGVLDTAGCWDCDTYGRPFNVNDLQAPPA